MHINHRLITFLCCVFFLSLLCFTGKAQDADQMGLAKRAKDNFDFNWQFHKWDIAIKPVVRVGQGSITDIDVPVITRKDTVIDYTDVRSSTSFNPHDWKEVNLPHDWCVEGTFVHD